MFKRLLTYWLPLWFLLSVAVCAGSLGLHLIILVQRFSTDNNEVFYTWFFISTLLSLATACGLAIKGLSSLQSKVARLTVDAEIDQGEWDTSARPAIIWKEYEGEPVEPEEALRQAELSLFTQQ